MSFYFEGHYRTEGGAVRAINHAQEKKALPEWVANLLVVGVKAMFAKPAVPMHGVRIYACGHWTTGQGCTEKGQYADLKIEAVSFSDQPAEQTEPEVPATPPPTEPPPAPVGDDVTGPQPEA